MQLYHLQADQGERNNLLDEQPARVKSLLKMLQQEVSQGRSAPGKPVSNDRDVTFLPPGVPDPQTE